MTFDPTHYQAVVINEFDMYSPVFDDQGNFLAGCYVKPDNVKKWAGHVAHAFKIDTAYDDLHIDGSPYGTYVDGLEVTQLSIRFYYYDIHGDLVEVRPFEIATTGFGTPTAVFEPAPMVYDFSLRYSPDSEFPAGANFYSFFVVLVTPTVMPSPFIINNTTPISGTFGIVQHVAAGYGVTPSRITEYPNWKFAYRITAYVEATEIPPLRLINRDDNVGKRPSPRLTKVNTRNNGSSLQAQQGLRVSNTANVWW